MIINLNSEVKVKLTSVGKVYLRKRHTRLYQTIDPDLIPPYNPPKEDEDGYSSWQLWDLMGTFGDALQYPTMHPPIEPNIVLVDEVNN